jgi:hypothetical protein
MPALLRATTTSAESSGASSKNRPRKIRRWVRSLSAPIRAASWVLTAAPVSSGEDHDDDRQRGDAGGHGSGDRSWARSSGRRSSRRRLPANQSSAR